MKSFSNFIAETSSGSKGSGYMPVWDDPEDPKPKVTNNKKKSNNKKSKSKKVETKPLSGKSRKELIKTNKSTGGKVTVNVTDATGLGKLNKPDLEADKFANEISKRPELQRLTADQGTSQLLNRIKSTPNPDANLPPGVRKPSDVTLRKGELGKLYKTGTKQDPMRAGSVRITDKISRDLNAKRSQRIGPDGKATQKGVENFAINQQTKGLSTKGVRGREALQNAKKLASNPNSVAYKDIERKINTSDYAGKRATLASTKELDKIAKELDKSKTLQGRGAKTGQSNVAPQGTIQIKPKGNVSIKSTKNLNLNKMGGPVRSTIGKIRNQGTTVPKPTLTFKDFGTKATAAKSNLRKLKITPQGIASKGLGKVFAAWNWYDNYKDARAQGRSRFGSALKSTLTTGAYYAGATGGASVGTLGGSFTGPGAFVTGAIGAIAGGETASNLTSRWYDQLIKPPTTKEKDKDKKVAIPPSTNSKNSSFTWNTGISIGKTSKKKDVAPKPVTTK